METLPTRGYTQNLNSILTNKSHLNTPNPAAFHANSSNEIYRTNFSHSNPQEPVTLSTATSSSEDININDQELNIPGLCNNCSESIPLTFGELRSIFLGWNDMEPKPVRDSALALSFHRAKNGKESVSRYNNTKSVEKEGSTHSVSLSSTEYPSPAASYPYSIPSASTTTSTTGNAPGQMKRTRSDEIDYVVKRPRWTVSQERELLEAISEHGNDWARIREKLTFRNYQQIKDKGLRVLKDKNWKTSMDKSVGSKAFNEAKEIARQILWEMDTMLGKRTQRDWENNKRPSVGEP